MVAFLLAPSVSSSSCGVAASSPSPETMPGWQPSAVEWSLWIKREVIEDDLLDLSSPPSRRLLRLPSSAPPSPLILWTKKTTTSPILTVCSDHPHHHQPSLIRAPGTQSPTPPLPAPGATTRTSAACCLFGVLNLEMEKLPVATWTCCCPLSYQAHKGSINDYRSVLYRSYISHNVPSYI
ncbi:hypothetical protein [Absidia glauca]|uniref:Uncharacterized protein n=1 Tax=Absidia glauca TaxID=4829 RepID=A0A163J3K4_ABSGL|nr:hypothetical protein [Absidia glauca]